MPSPVKCIYFAESVSNSTPNKIILGLKLSSYDLKQIYNKMAIHDVLHVSRGFMLL